MGAGAGELMNGDERDREKREIERRERKRESATIGCGAPSQRPSAPNKGARGLRQLSIALAHFLVVSRSWHRLLFCGNVTHSCGRFANPISVFRSGDANHLVHSGGGATSERVREEADGGSYKDKLREACKVVLEESNLVNHAGRQRRRGGAEAAAAAGGMLRGRRLL